MASSEAIATAKADLMKAGMLNATDADALVALAVAEFDLPADLTDQQINEHIARTHGHDAIRAGRVGLAATALLTSKVDQ